MRFSAIIRRYRQKPMFRPWALSGPVLVLLVSLPLLRPLRHPTSISTDEALRLATIEAIVKHSSLALDVPATPDPTSVKFVAGQAYADQPPMLAVLLSGPTWLMARLGFTLRENEALVHYVLTLLAVTLPVAGAAGLLYRMGRLFELSRAWRAVFATAVVFGSGLISYAVVLNPHAPAAVLLLCAGACLIHVTLSKLPKRGVAWVLLAGACAALAAALDPPAGLIAVLLLLVVPTLRMPIGYRVLAMLLFLIGAAAPIAVHAGWSRPINGEIFPGTNEAKIALRALRNQPREPAAVITEEPDSDDVINAPSRWTMIWNASQWYVSALIGSHGVLSHFPVMIVGLLGIGAVMHRHWPSFVKTFAAASALGAIGVIGFYGSVHSSWRDAMFASRWFIVFLPLLLFWSGAWMRRTHSPVSWSLAGALLVYSVAVSVIGMSEPYPREGFDRYTASQALQRLLHPSPPSESAFAGTSMMPAMQK